ncbi:hypothetical protein [Pseudomonas sp. BEA3.1]|uniref:hypothetical protein n=1 Tax=Pseudomonas sp. BEA3.1 TaxID=3083251 RepID=UPI0029654E12|nr:hypothetical protein [Pseudomonas sp. BEA3.1]MDW2777445.1 hypothetical protein [Pseudomonas sp. BEA3.1]
MKTLRRYDKEFHFNNAKALIETGDSQQLRYACLEMRMLIEAHVYQRLLSEVDELPKSIINTWQANKAVRLHCEFDRYADMDMHLEIKNPDGSDLFDISYHNLKKSELNKIYNALGSYLHLPMPEKLESYVIEKESISDMLSKLERVVSGNLIINKVKYEAIECSGCGKPIVFTQYYLETHNSITCQNDNCKLEYAIHDKGESVELSLDYRGFSCHVCHNEISLPYSKIADGFNFQCGSCSTDFKFELQIRTETPYPE